MNETRSWNREAPEFHPRGAQKNNDVENMQVDHEQAGDGFDQHLIEVGVQAEELISTVLSEDASLNLEGVKEEVNDTDKDANLGTKWEPLPCENSSHTFLGGLLAMDPSSRKDNVERQTTNATNVEEQDKPHILCRGPGHIRACSFCFFTDERFGMHWKCDRQCATIDGVWGQTVCCRECKPESVSPIFEKKLETQPKRVWKPKDKI